MGKLGELDASWTQRGSRTALAPLCARDEPNVGESAPTGAERPPAFPPAAFCTLPCEVHRGLDRGAKTLGWPRFSHRSRPQAQPRARLQTAHMSDSFLAAAQSRSDDSPSVPVDSNPRQKIAVLSEKVVDSNPYSRLMCAAKHALDPRTEFVRSRLRFSRSQGTEKDGRRAELRRYPLQDRNCRWCRWRRQRCFGDACAVWRGKAAHIRLRQGRAGKHEPSLLHTRPVRHVKGRRSAEISQLHQPGCGHRGLQLQQ